MVADADVERQSVLGQQPQPLHQAERKVRIRLGLDQATDALDARVDAHQRVQARQERATLPSSERAHATMARSRGSRSACSTAQRASSKP
jgi:hypothetical protein